MDPHPQNLKCSLKADNVESKKDGTDTKLFREKLNESRNNKWCGVTSESRTAQMLRKVQESQPEISNQIKSNLFNKRTTRPLTLQYKQYTVNTIN